MSLPTRSEAATLTSPVPADMSSLSSLFFAARPTNVENHRLTPFPFFKRMAFCCASLAASFLLPVPGYAANQTWGANGGSAWYTPTNWAGGAFPGLQGAAASNTDIATWTSAATASQFGINMGTNSLNLGAISIDSTRSTATSIGDSSSTAGVLRLYGATVNGVANVILRNNGTGLLTLQATQTGTMGVVLSNTTNNIINIDNVGGVTISAIMSDGAGGAKNLTLGGGGSGVLTLSGLNTYTGTTTISQGTLSAFNIVVSGGASNLGNATSAVVLGSASTAGTLSYTGNAAIYTRGFTVNAGGGGITSAAGATGLLTIDTNGIIDGGVLTLSAAGTNGITINSVVSSTGSVAVNSTGAGIITLAGANSYSGGTTLTAGALMLSGAGTLGFTNGGLNVNGGTLDFNGTNQGVGALTGTGGSILNNNSSTASTLTFGNGNATASYSGNITSGTGVLLLTKTGTGNEMLSGNNTYTGITTVSQGTLTIASNNGLGATGYTDVKNGATLALSGGITMNGTAAQNIYLAGQGVSGTATLYNVSGNNISARTIDLDATSGNMSIGSASGILTLSGPIVDFSGTAQLQITGAGAVALSGTSTYAGGTNVTGSLALGANNAVTSGVVVSGPVGKGTLTLSNGSLIRSASTTARTLENNLSLSGSVTLGDATNSGSLTFDSAGLNTPATIALAANTSSSVLSAATFGNAITGGFTFTKLGAGTLSFTGSVANTYSGLTTVSNGTLTLGKSASTNAIAGDLTINGGTVNYATNDEQIADSSNVSLSSGTFDLGTRTEAINSLTVSGGTLNRQGGTLTLNGATSITGGTLTFTATTSQISVQSSLALGGANFNYTSSSSSTTGLTLGGDVTYAATNTAAATFNNTNSPGVGRVNLGNTTRTFDIADSNTLAAGVPEVQVAWYVQNGGLTKTGTGVLALSGANTYSSGTAVSGGTLLANNTSGSGTGTGAVTVSNSGSALGGTGTVTGGVTINANAKVQGGDGTTGTTLTISGALTLASNSIVQLALGPSGAHSTLARTGSGTWTFDATQAFNFLSLGAQPGTYDNIITGLTSDPGSENSWTILNPGFEGTFTFDGNNIDLNLTTVPEPSTWAVGIMAAAAVSYSQRKRLRKKAKTLSA